MKNLIVLMLFPIVCFGQKSDLDSLIKWKDNIGRYDTLRSNYDSLIIVCNQIKAISKKAAVEEEVDYALAHAYFETQQYDKAIESGKIYLNISASDKTWEGVNKLIKKKRLCYRLSDIYKIKHDTANAVKYLLLIDANYHYGWGCLPGKMKRELYENIIACYTALNDKNKIAKYKHKLEEYEKGNTSW